MRLEFHHFLLLILLFAVAQVLVSGTPRTRINISSGPDDNCTYEGGVIVSCPCDVTINGTYYPCWIPINNGTSPDITCTNCSLGSFSTNETTNCTEMCPAGTCLEPYTCENCAPGHFSNITGATSCFSCPKGFFSRDWGAHNCTACKPGQAADEEGSTNCIPCQPGWYAYNFGSHSCSPCGAGTYSQSIGGTSCDQCPKGSYNDKTAQPTCFGCGVGKFGSTPGLTSKDQCLQCPAGSFCPDPVTATPQPCPRNHYCVAGSAVAAKCPLLYISEGQEESCNPGVGFYIVIFGCIGGAGICFAVVMRWRAVKQERLRRAYRQTEIDRLIPKPRDGPVYTGF